MLYAGICNYDELKGCTRDVVYGDFLITEIEYYRSIRNAIVDIEN